MSNVLKYTTGAAPSGSFKKGNFYIGNETSDYGATFYSGITPPPGGYTIYLNKGSGGPSIICPANDTELVYWTNVIAGSAYTTAQQCLDYFATQTDKVIVTDEYRGIVTDGLVLNLDADHVSSYPETGTTWYDLAGNNNGTLTNGPTFASGSIVFDGVDDYVSCNGTNPSLDITSEITMIAWVNPTTIGDSWQGIFLRETVGEYELWMYGNKLRYGLKLDGSLNRDSGNISLTTNKWYMLAWTYDGSAVRLYVNGVADSVFSKSGTITTSDRTMYIGYSGFSSEYFNGKIASCQLYNKALTHAEILQNYQAQLPTFLQSDIVTKGLVLDLDASYTTSYPGSGTTWSDLSGNGFTGTLTNGPTYSTASNGSIVFDGVDDYTNIPSLNGPSFQTIELFFKANSSSNKTLVSGLPTYRPRISLRNNIINVYYGMPNGTGDIIFTFDSIPTSQWYQLVYTYGGSTDHKCYLNTVEGVRTSNGSALNGIPSFTSLQLGPSAGSEGYFNGQIAIARIYNRVLTAAEILQNYHAQLNRAIVRDGLVLHLDAGNPDSYDGTGTRWFDLSGNQNFGNLTNGVGYMSASGSMTFDGVDDYVRIVPRSPITFTSISYNTWVYTTGAMGYRTIIDLNNDNMLLDTLHNKFGLYNPTYDTGYTLTANTWYNYSVSHTYGGPWYFYVNGALVYTSSNDSSARVAYTIGIGAGIHTNGYADEFWSGGIAIAQIYNRGLTAAEVQQNFEVQRSRFGI